MRTIAVVDDNTSIREILSSVWPGVKVITAADNRQCVEKITDGSADGALLMTYTAQKLAREDVRNRLRVDIVPGASIMLQMGVNDNDDSHFYGIWEKTLATVSGQISAEVVQPYLEETAQPTAVAYLFDHPEYMVFIAALVFFMLFLAILFFQSVKSRRRLKKLSDELAQALEEAKEANESKQNFFSKMSHDIRTPLNVVLGMTQIAQKYKYDVSRLENALESITNEGNYLLVLINSILDVNQLEHGYIELAKEPFNPVECVKSSVEILKPLAEKKEQKLILRCQCGDCVAVGDANRFNQIMINIISNAIKYTETGGQITVEFERLPDNYYRFVCTDNGIGMTEEFVKHICEDYVRAEDSRVSKSQGTGLGMSVVKGFIDLMKGRLQVDSRLGEGTTFTVELCFADATKEQEEAYLEAMSKNMESEELFTGKRVLLVEDNDLNAEIATELLESIGLSVDWADNGQAGLKRFLDSEPGSYFAVFMDMQMPE